MADGELEVLLVRVPEVESRIALRELIMARGAYYDGAAAAPPKAVTSRDDVTAEVTKLRDAVTERDAEIARLQALFMAQEAEVDRCKGVIESLQIRTGEPRAQRGGKGLTPAERAKAYRERRQKLKAEAEGQIKKNDAD